eukprot:3608031-Amphidinium_carterae.1
MVVLSIHFSVNDQGFGLTRMRPHFHGGLLERYSIPPDCFLRYVQYEHQMPLHVIFVVGQHARVRQSTHPPLLQVLCADVSAQQLPIHAAILEGRWSASVPTRFLVSLSKNRSGSVVGVSWLSASQALPAL